MTTFKIFFTEHNIRRLKFKSLPTFDEFVAQLKETYPSYFCGDKKFEVKYVDSDGDKISVSTQIEWDELLSQLGEKNVLKVIIESVEVKPEQKGDEECKKTDNFGCFWQTLEDVMRDIPLMTENFVQQCMDWEERNQVFWNLHRMSLDCLDSLDKNVIQKGKEAILKMLEIIPNHAIALYHLACAESLLGNVKEALATLEKAINAGYHDLTHMINDKDFDNIKNTIGFNKIIEKLQRILGLIPESSNDNNTEQPPLKTEQPPKNEQEPIVIDFKEEKKEAKVEIKRDLSPEEEKINILAEMFPLPKDILQELLVHCKGNMEKAIEMIVPTFN